MGTDFTPLLMFVSLLIALFSGIPIAFALSLISISFALVLWGPGAMNLLISAAWGTMNNFTLIAIPLFIFMAFMLEKSEVITDLYDCFYKWSGGLRGGLAIATILVGCIVGAVSGVVAAGIIGLGVIALPQMLGYKYDKKISLGAIMSGGTLGQLIPPSLNMVVYGSITGVSVGKMFAGGISVGLFLAFLYIAYILIRCFMDKDLCPAMPIEDRATWKEKFASLKNILLPSMLIVLVLGSILSGAATPTEGAAVGALGSILFPISIKKFKWSMLKEVCQETLRITSMVGWIILGAAAFSAVFSGVGGNALIQEMALSMPGGKWGALALFIVFITFLGMFLETVAIIMLAAPIVSPVLASFGFDPLWWGMVFMTLLQVAYLSPPFGFALFYLKGVTPEDVTIQDIYMSSLPFMTIQLLCVLFLIAFPAIAIWLPNYIIK